MSDGQLGQAPTPANSGRFLHKASVTGEQVDFVNDSNYAEGSVTLSATGNASNFDFATIAVSFDYTIDGITYPFESIIAWEYANFYVDGSGVGLGFESNLYRIGNNVSGSTALLRKTMLIDIFSHHLYNSIVAGTYSTHSHVNVWFLKNNDSTSHQVGIATLWKYIVTGDQNGN